jgi:hypothetical protein
VKETEVTTPTAQRKSLRELRESTGTLFAKNNTLKKITCNTDTTSFELDAKGGDNSITIVPKECLNVPGFQRLWMRGAISISDDEAMENEITLLMGGQVQVTPKVYSETWSMDKGTGSVEVEAQVMPPAESNDIVFKDNTAAQTPDGHRYPDVAAQARGYAIQGGNACLVPNCRNGVMIAQKFLDDGEPPLCQDHEHLKTQVAATPQPDGSWTHQLATIQPVTKSDLPAGG